MNDKKDYPRILRDNSQLGPYPMEKLKRVDKPTTTITDNIQRIDERDHGFSQAFLGRLGPIPQREIVRFVPKYPIGFALVNMAVHLKPMQDGDVASQKAPIPQDPTLLSRHIKSLGYFLRADIVGICQLPQWAVYAHNVEGHPIELKHKYAIVIVIDQDYRTMNGSRGDDLISGTQSYIGYTTSGFIACEMAAYIRKLGYPARAHYEGAFTHAYDVLLTPLLLLAGIGEMCRTGIVLNPFIGTRFKASVVTTDFPLEPDKPIDFGLQDFCKKCKICAVECPSKSISMDNKVMYNGYETWKFDFKTCTKFRLTNPNGSACGRCIKVCPWTKPPKGWIHGVVRQMVRHTPFMNKFIVKMDDVLGYWKQHEKDKWWFDLEEINGVLKIPSKVKH